MDGGLARGLFVLSSWSRQPGSMCGDCRNHRARLPVRLARLLARLTASDALAGLSANAPRECRGTRRGTVASANVSPIYYTCDRDYSRRFPRFPPVFPLDPRISVRRSRLRIPRISNAEIFLSFFLDTRIKDSVGKVNEICLFCLKQRKIFRST